MEPSLAKSSGRLESLDVFRGATIAAMILVSHMGDWSHVYPPLSHARWDGWTPTDFIFPFFLFIVGVAMTFSFDKRISQGADKRTLLAQVVRRTVILFLLGMILAGYPNFRLITPYILFIAGLGFLYADLPVFSGGETPRMKRRKALGWGLAAVAVLWFLLDFAHFRSPVFAADFAALFPLTDSVEGGRPIRVPGVLQRIALCYFFASLILFQFGNLGRIAWCLVLLNLHWILLRYIPAPGGFELGDGGGTPAPPDTAPIRAALVDWLDVKLLGRNLYHTRPDPEAILTTLPAIVTTLSGVLAGAFLRMRREPLQTAALLFIAGNILIIAGAVMDSYFPINKRNWTSSFVVFTTGWALAVFAVCYYLNDVLKWRRWSRPFLVFGTNAILVYFASIITARTLMMVRLTVDGESIPLRTWLYNQVFLPLFGTRAPDGALLSNADASLAFAVVYTAMWVLVCWPLHARRIFLRV